jgi:hypothetical protein
MYVLYPPNTASVVGNSLIFCDGHFPLASCEIDADGTVEIAADDSEGDVGEYFRLRPETLRIFDDGQWDIEEGADRIFFDTDENRQWILEDFPAMKAEVERRAYLRAVDRWVNLTARLNDDDDWPEFPIYEPARDLYDTWQAAIVEYRANGFRDFAKLEVAGIAYFDARPKTKREIELEKARSLKLAEETKPVPPEGMESATVLERFWWHMPSGKVLEETSRTFYAAQSVDKHIGRIKSHYMVQKGGPGMLASNWLAQNRFVDCVAWDPNKPLIVRDQIFQDEWIPVRGQNTFNIYLPPSIVPVEGDVSPWLNLLSYNYPAEWEHLIMWFAHRVQKPGEKCNHACVFVGEPGIGKDIVVQPVIAAIGACNFKSVSAKEFFNSDFNSYLESVMLRIDEVHDLGGESKYAFEDRTKTVIAAPPAHHFINAKYIPHHSCVNVTGVILTSNHIDALYIDPLDRRHFVCISERKQSDFEAGYFEAFGSWMENGGNQAVAYYLRNLDISSFHPKANPPATDGWRRIVAAGMAPVSGDLADIIEKLKKPTTLTIQDIRAETTFNTPQRAMLDDPANRRKIPRRLAECGYVVANNRDAKDGRWRTEIGRIQIYARKELTESERIAAAAAHAATIKAPEAPLPPPPR